MRKRRVLALLLALSLVVSGNGMTVLAAEQGADMPVSMSQEETQDIEDNSEEKEEASDSTEETSGTEDKSEETKTPEEGDTSDGEDGTEQGDTTENPENPDNAGETDPSAPKEDDTSRLQRMANRTATSPPQKMARMAGRKKSPAQRSRILRRMCRSPLSPKMMWLRQKSPKS